MEAVDSAPSVRPYGRKSPLEAVAFLPVAVGVCVDDATREDVLTKVLETVRLRDAVEAAMTPEVVLVLLEMEETLLVDDERRASNVEDLMEGLENIRLANRVTKHVHCTIVNFIFGAEILENTLMSKALPCLRRLHSRVVASLSSFLILPYTRFIAIFPSSKTPAPCDFQLVQFRVNISPATSSFA